MAERWISLADLADGAALLSQALAAGRLRDRLKPCFDGGAALALLVRSLANKHPGFEEYCPLLQSVSFPSGLMPISAVFESSLEDQINFKSFMKDNFPPTEEDELACQEGYYPVGPPNHRFYVNTLFKWKMNPDDPRLVVLAKQLCAKVRLPPNFALEESAIAAPAIFFRQLQDYLAAGTEVAELEEREEHIHEAKWADLYLPLVYLEKLKQLSERHKQQHGPDRFYLSPSKIQEMFKATVSNYDNVVQELMKEWLTHRFEPRARRDDRPSVCGVARNAAVWLFEMWEFSPEGERKTKSLTPEKRKEWVDWRAKEMQDTFDWVLGLLDNEHRKLPVAFSRSHMAAVHQRAQEIHWA